MSAPKILSAVLAVQVVFAAITWWPRESGPTSEPLFPFSSDAITAITIESETTRSLSTPLALAKKEGDWVVASQFDYPADADKVTDLLDKLTGLKRRLPIATNAVRHGQLNVTVENATRHLVVEAGDQKVDLYAGIAGGSRLNVRLEGSDEVYEVSGLGAWSIRDNATAFYDKRFLNVDPTTVDSFSLENANGTLLLTRAADGQWTSPSLDEGQALHPDKVDEMLSTLLTLDLFQPYDPSQPDPLQQARATVTWSVTEDGQSTTGRYGAIPLPQEEVAIHVEGQDRSVKLQPGQVSDMLATMRLTDLLPQPEDPL